MTFTDEKLKQLKRYLKEHENILVWTSSLLALLARLEAAENCIQKCCCLDEDDELILSWRKAAGK